MSRVQLTEFSYAICILFIALQWLKQQEGKEFPKRDIDEEAHIFSGMMIALSGRMSRSHVMPFDVLTDTSYASELHESYFVDA